MSISDYQKVFKLKVKKSMIKKVFPVIRENDIIEIDITLKPQRGEYVLFSHNTTQWIEKYEKKYRDVNCYKIIKIIMNN